MPLARRLRLDDVVTSFPELGPTVPDGGYAWIVLYGVFLVQMTIPSLLSMYGIVLGYINENEANDFDVWSEEIILAPILFTAFSNLADPWTRMIVIMASVPRLIGIIGVFLLAVGIIATGYLATGGVGAYLASSSAGAVMGVGASFVMLLSEYVLRKNFRKKLPLALTLKNIGASFGLVLIPTVTNVLLHEVKLKSGLLLMTIVLMPTALGILMFRLPTPQEISSPYSLLLSTEEDNELPIRISPDIPESTHHSNGQNNFENPEYAEVEGRTHIGGLYSEGNNIYAYENPNEDVDLFVNPIVHSDSKWKHQLRPLRTFRFWGVVVGWVGVKVSALFFWILLPVLFYGVANHSYGWMSLSTLAGFLTFFPSVSSIKVLQMTTQTRRLYFGLSSWLCSVALIGLNYATNYSWIIIYTILGGISIGSLSSCQDLPLYDILGAETVRCVHKGFYSIVGLCILFFCFVHSVDFCLNFTALLLFIGGFYWILSPVVSLIKDSRYTHSHAIHRTSRGET
ncbi:monocarboxylate transporter 3-like isoform X1 [Hylaeus volcanicus]|uniref:monocarboxylate transporter 3-like isoform X1 n=1 Tax=Hylaeus volcanicus TaxID=313075 RepID=UPI0023B83157|nr:monocarboxylate transporter 3-like isoform X1 [Hylaeus volcanicus]